MLGLQDLIITATWPDDSPARREARTLLYVLAILWAGLLASPFVVVLLV